MNGFGQKSKGLPRQTQVRHKDLPTAHGQSGYTPTPHTPLPSEESHETSSSVVPGCTLPGARL